MSIISFKLDDHFAQVPGDKRLLKALAYTPQVITVTDFDNSASYWVEKQVNAILASAQPFVPVAIDSFGGEVYACLRMIDSLEKARAAGRKVITYVSGKAMSAGCFLLAAGDPGMRFAAPRSTIMYHTISSVSFGKLVKADVKESDRLQSVINEWFAERTGKTRDFWESAVKENSGADLYLSPGAAKENGIVDQIGQPSLELHASLEWRLQP